MTQPANWGLFKLAVLRGLGAPDTPQNEAFLNAWQRREGNGGTNNPFNTTYQIPGKPQSTVPNTPGVVNYSSESLGVLGTVATLKGHYFGDVLADLRAGTASTTKSYYGLHAWSAGPNAPASKGYWNLSGTPTTAGPGPWTGGGGAQIGAPAASNQRENACRFHTPFPGMRNDLCLDKLVGVAGMVGGALLIFAGLAVITAAVLGGTKVGKAASQVANVIPTGRALNVAKGMKAKRAARPAKGSMDQAAEDNALASAAPATPSRREMGPARTGAERAQRQKMAAARAGDQRTIARARRERAAASGGTMSTGSRPARRPATRAEAGF